MAPAARKFSAAALGLCLLAACAKREEGKPPPPKVEAPKAGVGGHAEVAAMPGWNKRENVLGVDYMLELSRSPYLIRLQLLGGRGSAAPTIEEAGKPAAAGGGAARYVASLSVAGRSAMMYARDYQIFNKPPEGGEQAPTYVREEFVVVPAGKRFFRLSHYTYSRDGEFGAAHGDWAAFLSGFKIIQDY